MIILSVPERVLQGITQHFPIRRTEWIALFPFFGMWLMLQLQPTMFSTSPSFAVVKDWGIWWVSLFNLAWTAEAFMAVVLLTCGVIRLAALTINGTFHQFRFSPHLRFGASLIGLAFWSQWTLGVLVAFVQGTGAASGVIAYGTICLLELANLAISSQDLGGEIKRVVTTSKARKNGL